MCGYYRDFNSFYVETEFISIYGIKTYGNKALFQLTANADAT
jgi:hypothetical protein